jgi:NtrC-family two-component system sensor histidine kinase KinB
MKLQQKVILAQLPLGLIIAIMGFLFVFTIGHIGSNTNDILVSNYRSIVALQKMRQSLDGFDNTVWRLMTKEYKSKGEILYLIDNYKQEFETQLAVQKSNVVIEGELESTESLEKKWHTYRDSLDEFISAGLTSTYLSHPLYEHKLRPKYTILRDSIHALTDLNQDDIYYRSEGVAEMVSNVSQVMIVFAIAAFMCGVMISGLLTNKIMSPLRGLTDLVRKITEGKMGVRLSVHGNDEVAELGKEFNSMASSLEAYRHSSIGELVRAKLFMQVAIDTLPDPLLIVNQIGKTLNLNKTARKEFDYTDDPEIAFDDFLEKLPYVIKQRTDQIIEFIFTNPNAQIPKELTKPIIASYNYKLVEFVPIIQPISEPTIGVIAAAIIFRNITNIDVKGYIKADKFVSLTHELLLPLNSIHIALHTCLEKIVGDINPKQEEFLSAARNDCFRIKKMITSLQDLDKLEDITQNTEKAQVSLTDIINESTKAMEVIAASKNVKIEFELALLFDKVYGNRDQLKLVFNNLIDNAIHHSPIGDVMTIKLQEKDKEIMCLVHNRGSYIPAEYHGRVFDKFFQMPSDNSHRDGLGLYIAKNIIEQHNGKIGVRSSQRLGTTFWVKLPKATS